MARTIYQNNKVEITAKSSDQWETEIEINGQNLIVISSSDEENFKNELSEVLDKYRI